MNTPISANLRILAAGSLRHALTQIFVARDGPAVDLVFGPSGLLRQRIEQGEACDLFLSANLDHPRALAETMPGATVTCFTRNQVAAAARQHFGMRTDNFLETLLCPATRIATSTPGADPGGDYAVSLFRRADALVSGAGAALVAKSRAMVGGATAPDVPDGIHPIAHFLAAGAADVFICYQTTGQSLQGSFDIVLPPPALSVIAEYGGVVVARDAVRREAASGVWASLLSGPAQAVFARYGFLMR